ncbi:ATP-grasp domain-containing protein [Acholeplasma granularum]|uniref:ATP-grasp domain-containing protein n=1 Tax=Acholeplasma granularum TaxID=264635 RepID=UPI0004B624DE|nr:ATP-grasp domain-containing protein [Acholeplasma granularum]
MNNYNILILSAGRRVELIQAFKKAAKKLNINSSIIAADMSGLAPALYFADKHKLIPAISDINYIDNLISLCNEENVKLVVPTIDTELLILAENKQRIESETNAKVMISDLKLIQMCRDKIKTSDDLSNNGFLVPYLYGDQDIKQNKVTFPCFIKPKSGSSSINAFKVNNDKELELYRKFIPDYMLQEYVGGDEYTIDVFLDFNSNPITIVPRLRLATRSGEISKGLIVKHRIIIDTIKNMMDKFKFIGHITVQLKIDKDIKFIEINPRFGGGAPMSIAAGADSCENLYRLLMGEQLSYNEVYEDDVYFLRYDSSIMVKKGEIIL